MIREPDKQTNYCIRVQRGEVYEALHSSPRSTSLIFHDIRGQFVGKNVGRSCHLE